MNQDILIDHQRPGKHLPCDECGAVLDISSFKPLEPIFCPKCETEMVVPARVGTYQLYKFLGEGAMGRVYLAKDPGLGRDVAVKILREDLNATPKMWSMLEEEAKAAAGITHNNVIQVYTMGKILGRPYIVMELATESSLEDYMSQQVLTEHEAITLGLDVLRGLLAAAQNRLMHGDVKPANILVGPPGYTKIADFGLARFLQEGQPVERWGTPYYIAPEKSQQIQEDFRSDMYSLGATLFHAVAGRAPFEGDTGGEVISKSLKSPTPKLHKTVPGVSIAFSDVLARLMARDPDDRFPDYETAIQCFEDLRDGCLDSSKLRPKKKVVRSWMKRAGSKLSELIRDPN